MSKNVFDLIIVGSGPAGSILAYLLGQSGLSVCVTDRRSFNGGNPAFTKACGGLLAPDAQRALARLSFSLPADILASPQIFAVKTIDLETGLHRFYQRCYLNMNREKFDAYLASLSDNTAVKYYGRCVHSITYDKLYRITLSDGTILESRMLAGADGAASVTAKALGLCPDVKKYVCIQQLFEAPEDQQLYSAVFDRRLTDYSGWTFVKDGVSYVGAAFSPDCRAHKKLDSMIEDLEAYGYRFGKPIRREGAMLNRPLRPIAAPVSRDGSAALIGEAAGFVSPSSAEGISFAVNSAVAAYQSLKSRGDFSGYAAASAEIRRKLFLKNFKLPFMYNRFLRTAVLKSGISAIDPLLSRE